MLPENSLKKKDIKNSILWLNKFTFYMKMSNVSVCPLIIQFSFLI